MLLRQKIAGKLRHSLLTVVRSRHIVKSNTVPRSICETAPAQRSERKLPQIGIDRRSGDGRSARLEGEMPRRLAMPRASP